MGKVWKIVKGGGVVTDQTVTDLVLKYGYKRREKPFRLASNELSNDYINGKQVVARGERLRAVTKAVLEVASRRGIDFDAAGGLTMGADPVAHGIAYETGKEWFSVRKERKNRGDEGLIEGADISEGTRVLLVDDIVTTGNSILQALEAVAEVGGNVVLAVCLVDRGKTARDKIEGMHVIYEPLTTYEELGIDPVGGG